MRPMNEHLHKSVKAKLKTYFDGYDRSELIVKLIQKVLFAIFILFGIIDFINACIEGLYVKLFLIPVLFFISYIILFKLSFFGSDDTI